MSNYHSDANTIQVQKSKKAGVANGLSRALSGAQLMFNPMRMRKSFAKSPFVLFRPSLVPRLSSQAKSRPRTFLVSNKYDHVYTHNYEINLI